LGFNPAEPALGDVPREGDQRLVGRCPSLYRDTEPLRYSVSTSNRSFVTVRECTRLGRRDARAVDRPGSSSATPSATASHLRSCPRRHPARGCPPWAPDSPRRPNPERLHPVRRTAAWRTGGLASQPCRTTGRESGPRRSRELTRRVCWLNHVPP